MDLEFSQAGGAVSADAEINLTSANPGTSVLRCVVAIPAKDEAERLPVCLEALANQTDRSGGWLDRKSYGIVIFANNCHDQSAEIARSVGSRLALNLRVVEVGLAPGEAHAGRARRGAMDIAENWLASARSSRGVVMTTDADSRVSPDWIVNNLAAIAAGADAVLGAIELDEEGDRLPEALHHRGRLESEYELLLTETSAIVDPVAHDPWPHHSTISGASLAIRRESYLRVGGLPIVPLGEDKALVAALAHVDAKIRHSNDVRVTTSGRCQGRAPGGVADTLRLRSADPSAVCDEALEPYRIAFRRAKWRRWLRLLWRTPEFFHVDTWSRGLNVPPGDLERIAASTSFGSAWEEIENLSPRLVRRPLAPAELPAEIAKARGTVGRLRRLSLATQDRIEPEVSMPVAALELAKRPDAFDE